MVDGTFHPLPGLGTILLLGWLLGWSSAGRHLGSSGFLAIINLIMDEPSTLSTRCSWAAALGGMARTGVQTETVKSFPKVIVSIHTPGGT